MKKTAILCFVFSSMLSTVWSQVTVDHLLLEQLVNPIGIDVLQPNFSWQLQSTERNLMQTAYEIRVAEDAVAVNKGKSIWNSGKIHSDQSNYVPYTGAALTAGKRYYWQVRVWDNKGKTSAWSPVAFWQMGLLSPADWKASWITPATDDDKQYPSPLVRKEFNNNKRVKQATVYITAHGLYEAQLNGKRIGDAYLVPGWTSYNKHLQYQSYDVTSLIQQGKNVIAATLGDGWYRGNFSFDNRRNIYGSDIALLCQLELIYADGTTETIVSDNSWRSSTGAIRSAGIYEGEIIDARLDKKGWTLPGYDDSKWPAVHSIDSSKKVLRAAYNEPIRKQELIKPLRVFTSPSGEKLIDFGQNMVGWVQLKAIGKAGDTIRISHAEVLDKAGNFYTENLRAAKAQDQYVLAGNGQEFFEPHFTFHGFRYIKIEGYPGEIKPENFTAVVLYSDMPATGSFHCSDTLINQLQHNIEWGLRGNFLDVPTDCPQRNERMGWTGDAQVFFRTASFLRGAHNFFSKWLKDVAFDQLSNGAVPHVIPNVLGNSAASAGWADVSTIIPWQMYEVYGDKRVLQDQYASMKAWVEFMHAQSKDDLWNTGFHFGDWLYYSVIDDNDGKSAITNKYFIAQCFYAHSTQLLLNAASILGNTQDVVTYTELLRNIKAAFLKEYVTPNGATMSNTQTSYVLALQFDMLPEALRQQAADRLVANIKQYNNHLTTGFLGTPYLCHVLSRYGYDDVAYTLLLQKTYPSWLYPVTKGATTIWERWDGIRSNGDFQAKSMNSFNHYAYGAIGDWMYRVMVGLDNEEGSVGYKKIRIQPHIGGGLTQANASYETLYGKLAANWELKDDQLKLMIEIPTNTTARVLIPATHADAITEQGKTLKAAAIETGTTSNGWVEVKLGSGKYEFTSSYHPK